MQAGIAVTVADNYVVVVGGVEHLAADSSSGAAGLSDTASEVTDIEAADVDLVVVVVAELGPC